MGVTTNPHLRKRGLFAYVISTQRLSEGPRAIRPSDRRWQDSDRTDRRYADPIDVGYADPIQSELADSIDVSYADLDMASYADPNKVSYADRDKVNYALRSRLLPDQDRQPD